MPKSVRDLGFRNPVITILHSLIQRIQQENINTYDGGRKPAITYKIGDLVAMKRTQMTQGKLTTEYLGPYEVTDVGPRERYVVVKMGVHEGPNRTSTVAD